MGEGLAINATARTVKLPSPLAGEGLRERGDPLLVTKPGERQASPQGQGLRCHRRQCFAASQHERTGILSFVRQAMASGNVASIHRRPGAWVVK